MYYTSNIFKQIYIYAHENSFQILIAYFAANQQYLMIITNFLSF
jgi:hypothetical protein